MKNNFHIFIILSICSLIISQDCENVTNVNEQSCLIKSETGKYPNICCFYQALYPENDNETKCRTIPYSSYFSEYNREYIDGILYNVTCNNTRKTTTYVLEQCGNTFKEVKSLSDCKKYSTFVDSCCYYSGPKTDQIEKGCYWLGSKYEGNINWAGVQLECYQYYLHNSLISILSLIILIFVIF